MNSEKNPKTFRKRNKRQIKSQLRKTGIWHGFMCPSKCYPRPGNPMNMAIEVYFTKDMMEFDKVGAVSTPMERIINAFEHYNCDHERGQYVHYYEYWEAPADEGLHADSNQGK